MCTCNTEGEIECECKEQDVTCEDHEEVYTDENCEKLCAKGKGSCITFLGGNSCDLRHISDSEPFYGHSVPILYST